MQRADWLAIAGFVLTIIFGLPSIAFFQQGNRSLGAVAIFLALLTAGLTLYIYRTITRPPWTVLSHHTRAEIRDRDGEIAVVRKTVRLSPNHPGLQHYTHRNISCDGSAVFTVDSGVRVVTQTVEAGDYHLTVEFPSQLRRFHPVTTWLEATLTAAFTGNREAVILLVDQPIRTATLEILLPEHRPPQAGTVRAVYRYSGKDEKLPPPEVVGSGIVWTRTHRFRCLPFGEYEVSWRW